MTRLGPTGTAARRDAGTGKRPTVETTRLAAVVVRDGGARATTFAGRKSMPSGFDRYPGADEATPVWPYCQTIRLVRGSIRITRSP
jgi:hypothetical protein